MKEEHRGGRNDDKVIVKGVEESMVCGKTSLHPLGSKMGGRESQKQIMEGCRPRSGQEIQGERGWAIELRPRQKHSQWVWGPGACPSLAALLEGAGGWVGAAGVQRAMEGVARLGTHTGSGPWR